MLDNPLWHALTTTHAGLALRRGGAARYPADVAPMAGVADPDDPACWADLAALLGPGGRAALFLAAMPDLPAGLTVLRQRWIEQMIGPAVAPEVEMPAGFAVLGEADVPDMLALVARTEPGPFGPRTVAMGRYLGIRDAGGALVAMAGERAAMPGFVEISAVCTAPEAQGRGYGAALVGRLTAEAIAGGRRPFLHVKTENDAARRLYLRLGYTTRAEMHLSVVQGAPG